jgi:hypothetical protein
MSAGDIDDTLGPEGRLTALRAQYPDLDRYLSRIGDLKVERACVPFGAGISNDGLTVYIDPRIDTICDGTDLAPALVVHESTEWALRTFCEIGEDYANDPTGHRLANRAEYVAVGLLLAHKAEDAEEAWQIYDDFIDPQVMKLEFDTIGAVAPDLDLYPYAGNAGLEGRVRAAQERAETKEELHYTDKGSPEEHCANCEYYLPDRACLYVLGEVSKAGWCENWEGEDD